MDLPPTPLWPTHLKRKFQPPDSSVHAACWACLILTLVAAALTLFLEMENYHFDGYFPLRVIAGHHGLAPFSKDLLTDEDGWRAFKFYTTGEERWFEKTLNAGYLQEMHERIAENGRWNRLVIVARPLGWMILCAAIGAVICAAFITPWREKWRPGTRWALVTYLLVAGDAMVLLLVAFGRDYAGIFVRIWAYVESH